MSALVSAKRLTLSLIFECKTVVWGQMQFRHHVSEWYACLRLVLFPNLYVDFLPEPDTSSRVLVEALP